MFWLVRLKGFEKLVRVDEALRIFLKESSLKALGKERLPPTKCYGRVLASDVKAEVDVPPFDRSAMDGYAIRSSDSIGASPFTPKALKLVENAPIGVFEAKRVWTGGPIPEGADAVIELEYTRKRNREIEILNQVAPWRNVSRRGEDIKRGEVALEAGVRLRPQHIGLAASLGIRELEVVRTPKVALISTGSELVSLGEKPKEGEIIDSNKLILSGMCLELGAEPIDYGIARDTIDEIAAKIHSASQEADLILTTGGTSVGKYDLVPSAIETLDGGEILVHGVALRPGMPTALGKVKMKPIIALSGNPVAAMVGFEIFARQALLSMMGAKNEGRPIVKGRLTRNVASTLGFKVFLRVKVTYRSGEFCVEPVRAKGSSIITSMCRANGYVLIPEDREGLKSGEEVTVYLFNTVGG